MLLWLLCSGWAGFVVLKPQSWQLHSGITGSWREELHTRHSLARCAVGPVAPEPRHSPGSRHTSIFPTQTGRRRLAKCKGVAKGTASKRSWDSNPVKCTQPWPQASKKLLDWISFFFFKIQRNKRGGGEKKKKMFFFFTLDDYLKSPCSFAQMSPTVECKVLEGALLLVTPHPAT